MQAVTCLGPLALDYPHAAQALRIRRRRYNPATDRWSTVTVYAITNLAADQAGPAELADWIRGHWSIEVLHHIRDKLRDSAGVDAFLTLEQTADGEGLFDGELWVAEDAGEVAGFVALDDDEVTWLYVDPARYRRGVGRALLRHAVAAAGPRVEVTVLDGNPAALALYRSEGFVIQETKTGPLVGNEAFTATGHIMELRKQA